MLDELLLVSSIELADLIDFFAVCLFLDNFHSFLANVEANVFGSNAFGLLFLS